MNSVNLTGRLTRDPELRSTPGGRSVADLRLAVDRRNRDADPVYVDVVAWEGLGENAARYLSKGREVAVSGRLDYREWEAEDGSRRSRHSVVAESIDFLGGKRQAEASDDGEPAAAAQGDEGDTAS